MAEDPDPTASRDALVETIRATARWRAQVAREHVDDHVARRRSHRAMTGLAHLAKHVAGLDPDDRDLRWLRHLEPRPDGTLTLADESRDLLSRFGMDKGAQNHGRPEPTDAQVRNLLRRMDGAEANERAARRRDES